MLPQQQHTASIELIDEAPDATDDFLKQDLSALKSLLNRPKITFSVFSLFMERVMSYLPFLRHHGR